MAGVGFGALRELMDRGFRTRDQVRSLLGTECLALVPVLPKKAYRLLRPSGQLAFWSAVHGFPEGFDPFFTEIQDVYDEIGEGVPDDHVWLGPGELPDQTGEIVASGLFDVALVRQLDWEKTYDADSFIALLDTFSGHIAMEDAKRVHLYAEIRRRLAERSDGLLRRHWGAVLHVAAPLR